MAQRSAQALEHDRQDSDGSRAEPRNLALVTRIAKSLGISKLANGQSNGTHDGACDEAEHGSCDGTQDGQPDGKLNGHRHGTGNGEDHGQSNGNDDRNAGRTECASPEVRTTYHVVGDRIVARVCGARPAPTPKEHANELLLYLARKEHFCGRWIEAFDPAEHHYPEFLASIGWRPCCWKTVARELTKLTKWRQRDGRTGPGRIGLSPREYKIKFPAKQPIRNGTNARNRACR
jgi:hypothetical protein